MVCRMRHVAYDITAVGTWTCWAVVGVVWAAGAALASRRRPVRRREGHDLASLTGVAIGMLVVATPQALWRPLTVGSPWVRLAGLLVLLAATAGTVAARLTLGPMWSSAATVERTDGLRTSGPYRVTRHPIYTGILAMLVGTALTQGLGRWAALLVGVTAVLGAKIRAEERLLSSAFPEEYERYRQQVPQLFPRPRRRRREQPEAEGGKAPA
jgi:protein-S-isoprenylcysteine O-methyltransferase Ste14